MRPLMENENLIPNFQLEFGQKHASMDQMYRIARLIEYALEDKKVFSAVFFASWAFDKVRHEGLIVKFEKLPQQEVEISK